MEQSFQQSEGGGVTGTVNSAPDKDDNQDKKKPVLDLYLPPPPSESENKTTKANMLLVKQGIDESNGANADKTSSGNPKINNIIANVLKQSVSNATNVIMGTIALRNATKEARPLSPQHIETKACNNNRKEGKEREDTVVESMPHNEKVPEAVTVVHEDKAKPIDTQRSRNEKATETQMGNHTKAAIPNSNGKLTDHVNENPVDTSNSSTKPNESTKLVENIIRENLFHSDFEPVFEEPNNLKKTSTVSTILASAVCAKKSANQARKNPRAAVFGDTKGRDETKQFVTYSGAIAMFREIQHNRQLDGLPRYMRKNAHDRLVNMYTVADCRQRAVELAMNSGNRRRSYPAVKTSDDVMMPLQQQGLNGSAMGRPGGFGDRNSQKVKRKRGRPQGNDVGSPSPNVGDGSAIGEANIVKSKRRRTTISMFAPSFTGKAYDVADEARDAVKSTNNLNRPANNVNNVGRSRSKASSAYTNRDTKANEDIFHKLSNSGFSPDSASYQRLLRKLMQQHVDRNRFKVSDFSRIMGTTYMYVWRFLKDKPITESQFEEVNKSFLSYLIGEKEAYKNIYLNILGTFMENWATERQTLKNLQICRNSFSVYTSRNCFLFAAHVQDLCYSFDGSKMEKLSSYAAMHNKVINGFEELCDAVDKRINAALTGICFVHQQQQQPMESVASIVGLLENATLSFVRYMHELYHWNASLPIDIFTLIVMTWRKVMYKLRQTHEYVLIRPAKILRMCVWRFEEDLNMRKPLESLLKTYKENREAIISWTEFFAGLNL
eukprot:CAMPEP_0204821866 /NCGR_PEP_ID=MMETSP1346-20131115/66_1 /ASSEMBLY_ACC=CAM_ASM_000771 /TAXON_ID=215587 /ORGANISM="Aplanochytrium stocchinoi, Strain GSBS06" /LENGTH=777 /DNA_ID=CAMNT_0051947815 /DNA_START=71 /DNA_END=2404 /DNA_ORIENTATION=+